MRARVLIQAISSLVVLASLTPVFAGGKVKPLYTSSPIKSPGTWALPYNDHEKMIICTNRSVPPNWVIVGVRHTPGCNGLSNNSWVIQRLPNYPGADIIICSCQPVPPGWGVVEEVKSHYCGHGLHGVRIRKL